MQKNLLPYLNRLRNHEFAEAYHLICNELETDEQTQPNVAQAIEAVKEYAKQMAHLAAELQSHPSTAEITSLKEKRHQALLSIRGRIAYLQRSPSASIASHAKILHRWLGVYHEFFRVPTINGQSRLVSNIETDIDKNDDLVESVEAVNMLEDFMHIGAFTTNLRNLDAARKKDWEADRVKAVQVRQEALKKLVALWRVLEVSVALELDDIKEAKAMAHEINTVMIYFKRKHASKLTRRENQKQMAPPADEPIDNTDDEIVDEPTEVEDDQQAPEPTPPEDGETE